MATESPLLHDGAQNVLSTQQSAQNSTVTGSTLAGPGGSGQFLAVCFSTANLARQVSICSTLFGAQGSSVSAFYGILQNKPAIGQAADIGIFGISKAVAGSTGILAGSELQTSSTNAGVLVPWAAGNGSKVGFSLEAITAVGQVFSMALYGFGAGPGST